MISDLVVQAGADILEIGDPLLKIHGMEAVRRVRRRHPYIPLVVEFSSSDWVDDQISAAAKSGADIVLVLGLYAEPRIQRAVHSARNAGVGLFVDVPTSKPTLKWARIISDLGVDGGAIIRNIDSGTLPSQSLRRAREIRNGTKIPLAISGGFSETTLVEAVNFPWNIVIVGRAIIHAPDPFLATTNILRAMKKGLSENDESN